jgi:hypothetical protein
MFYNWEHREKLPELIRRNNFTYFEILDNAGRNNYTSIAENSDQVAEELENLILNVDGGEFTVIIYPDKKKKLGTSQVFKYKKTNVAQTAINGYSAETLKDKIELERLKWEREQIEKTPETPQINPYVAGLQTTFEFMNEAPKTPLGAALLNWLNRPKQGVAGLPSELEQINEIIQSTGFANQIYGALLQKLKTDVVGTLTKIQNALK